MLIKVCGMTEESQVRELDEYADLIGYIFYNKSPRFIKTFISMRNNFQVGVFVNESNEEILKKINKHGLTHVQLHGNESPKDCEQLQSYAIVIKAFGIHESFDFTILGEYISYIDYFLFDTNCIEYGGSGKSFNWDFLNQYNENIPFILSGGINPESLNCLIKFNHPAWAGIDLNSGFEISPGKKNIKALKKFIHGFKNNIIYTT